MSPIKGIISFDIPRKAQRLARYRPKGVSYIIVHTPNRTTPFIPPSLLPHNWGELLIARTGK